MTPWAIARQAPLSMEFSRQEYWSGLPFLTPRDRPNPGLEPASLCGLHWQQILWHCHLGRPVNPQGCYNIDGDTSQKHTGWLIFILLPILLLAQQHLQEGGLDLWWRSTPRWIAEAPRGYRRPFLDSGETWSFSAYWNLRESNCLLLRTWLAPSHSKALSIPCHS